MAHNNADALDAFGRALNLNLSFNSDGVCDLILDDGTVITLEGDPAGTSLRVNGVVGHLPEPPSAPVLRLLLQANFNGQGTSVSSLGLDHVSGDVVLGRSVDVSTLGSEGLVPVLTEFANHLVHWCDRLPTLVGGESVPRQPTPPVFLRG